MIKLNAWMSWPPVKRSAFHPRLRAVCYNEWNHAVVLLIALAKGFFAEGLEVELLTVEGHAGEIDEIEIKGLESGAWDIALDTLTAKAVAARSRGLPIVIVGARRRTHSFLLFGQKGMNAVEELKGAKLIACSPNDEMDIQSRQVLRDHRLEPGRDVQIVYGGLLHNIRAMEDSFRRGEGAGLMATLPQGKRLRAEGYPVLADLGKLYPPRHDRVMVARESLLCDYPLALKGFLKGIVRANRYFLDRSHREEIVRIVTDAAIFSHEHDKNVFEEIFEALYERIPESPLVESDGLERIIQEEQAKGQVAGDVRAGDLLRLGAMAETLEQLSHGNGG